MGSLPDAHAEPAGDGFPADPVNAYLRGLLLTVSYAPRSQPGADTQHAASI